MSKDINIKNKKAYFDYEFIIEEIAGMILFGSEIKSIRQGNASIKEAYCRIDDGEMIIVGMHIAEFKQANRNNHEPYRNRKLLLTKKQIEKFEKNVSQKGLTLVPLKLFIDKRGYAKLKIALCRGKKEYDKRATIKERDVKRDLDRSLK